jgi:hypothetical protein
MNPSRSIALVSAAALATCGAAAAKPAGTTPLNLESVQKTFVMVPAADMKTGPKVGDRMIFTQVLYNRGRQFGKPSGARVGTAEVICTILTRASFNCTVTAHLPGGELILTGTNRTGSKHMNLAVIGGDGIYSNARGSASGVDISNTKSIVSGSLDL